MSKTGEISSKAVAARIPMTDYIRILKEATEGGMSINDWLLIKIYNTESKEYQEIKIKLETKEKEQQKTENLLAEASGEIANLKKEVADLKKDRDSLNKLIAKNQAEIESTGKSAKTYADQIKSLQSQITDLQKADKAKEAKYTGMMSEAHATNKALAKELEAAKPWKEKFNQVVASNFEIRQELQALHENGWGIPKVLALLDQKMKIA